uniref:Uncharacterized protein n=1 Tax=Meloidogyne incognita TaxID=6306 RepID=A0A914L2E0_MELIC
MTETEHGLAKTRNNQKYGARLNRQNTERQNTVLPKYGTTKIRTIPKRGIDRTRTCQSCQSTYLHLLCISLCAINLLF